MRAVAVVAIEASVGRRMVVDSEKGTGENKRADVIGNEVVYDAHDQCAGNYETRIKVYITGPIE